MSEQTDKQGQTTSQPRACENFSNEKFITQENETLYELVSQATASDSVTIENEHFFERFGGPDQGREVKKVKSLRSEDLEDEGRIKVERVATDYRSKRSSLGASMQMSSRPSTSRGLTAAPVAGFIIIEAMRGGAGVSRPGIHGCHRGGGGTTLWAWLLGRR